MNIIPPIAGNPPITQNYGDNPGGNNPPAGHNGRDYGVPVGTEIRAVCDGVIDFEGWTSGPYQDNPWWFLPGDMVIVLDTGTEGPSFVYGHLSDTLVNAGDHVTQGQIIGHTGNTGLSTGPHLHFEALDPYYDLNSDSYGRTDPGKYLDHGAPVPDPTPAPAPAPDEKPSMQSQLDYITSPLFKVHIFTGQSPEEIAAREQFIDDIVKAIKA